MNFPFRLVTVATILVSLITQQDLRASDPETAKQSPDLADPIIDGPWLRPAQGVPAKPVWGHKEGISVGLWPMPGPRGLIRIYTPYVGQQRPRMINFIAIEPIVAGERGQSELEIGLESQRRGLDFRAANTRQRAAIPSDPTRPPPGQIERVQGIDTLSFCLGTEPFRNGARPIVQVIFRQDRPHEVGFRVYAAAKSAELDACVLTATMGNYARIRRLWLRGKVVDSRQLWPAFQPDPLGFACWRQWSRDALFQRHGKIIVAATSNDDSPARADYSFRVLPGWRYQGRPATQYWRTSSVEEAVVRVNGRKTYWGGNAPIPGGASFENFELRIPFEPGQEFWFGVSPDGPSALGFDPDWGDNLTDGP